jgi:hypothetical protein
MCLDRCVYSCGRWRGVYIDGGKMASQCKVLSRGGRRRVHTNGWKRGYAIQSQGENIEKRIRP